MFRLLRPRPFLPQGQALLGRAHLPPQVRLPDSIPFHLAAVSRSISLHRRTLPSSPPTPIRLQKQTLLQPVCRFPLPQRRLLPAHRLYSSARPPTKPTLPPVHDPVYTHLRLQTARPLLTWQSINSTPTYTIIVLAITGALIFYFSNLETVPVSGRTRFNVYTSESVKKAGEMEYKRLMYELESKGIRVLPAWDGRTVRVRRVMERLLPFSGMLDEGGNNGEGKEGHGWEVYVVDDPRTANAFVLPGGKVFVFSGILPLARNDSGLATVLGHEIAHNLAQHVGERLSQDIGATIVLYSLVIMGGVFGLGPLIMHLFGSRLMDVAFGYPMSRLQESEADYIGLMMMAEACYDPAEAALFWARMERAAGMEVPEWMSTHPTNVNRIKKIQEWLPEAMQKRAQSDCSTTASFADLFRHALRTGQVIMV